jgi:hypothetical protein
MGSVTNLIKYKWTIAKSKNSKNFNSTDITERITKEPTSLKHSIINEITGGRVHPARRPTEWV